MKEAEECSDRESEEESVEHAGGAAFGETGDGHERGLRVRTVGLSSAGGDGALLDPAGSAPISTIAIGLNCWRVRSRISN